MDTTRTAHILLIEDQRMDVELTTEAFSQARLANKVHPVRDGQQALDYLFGKEPYADRKKFPLPDLILLDLKLPRIDGTEVLRRIKTSPNLKRIPVIILTSSGEHDDRARSYDCGANSYLVKPISFDGFLEVVHTITHYWFNLNVEPPMD